MKCIFFGLRFILHAYHLFNAVCIKILNFKKYRSGQLWRIENDSVLPVNLMNSPFYQPQLCQLSGKQVI